MTMTNEEFAAGIKCKAAKARSDGASEEKVLAFEQTHWKMLGLFQYSEAQKATNDKLLGHVKDKLKRASEQLTDKSAAAVAIWWLRNCPWKPIGKLNWLFRSIRWRAVAAYNIGWWVMFLGAPMKDWIPIGNRGEVIKWAWEFYREQEFPGRMYTVAEVMQPVMGFKHNSEGQLEQTFEMKGFAIEYHSDGTKRTRQF